METKSAVSPVLKDTLVCASCGGDLSYEGQISCPSCHTTYESINGVPWVFIHGDSVKTQWRSRCRAFISLLNRQHDSLQGYLRQAKLLKTSKERLEILSEACTKNAEQLRHLLLPLLDDECGEWQDLPSAVIQNKVPSKQGPRTYLDLIFRDWAWDNQENSQAFSMIKEALPPGCNLKHLFVLGCGAGRLSWDLSNELPNTQVVAVDINPLLVLAGQKVIAGGQLDLYEIPVSPTSAKNSATMRKLRAKAQTKGQLQFLYADALNFPVKKNSIEAILTPWLIDVIPQDLRQFALRMNRSLKNGGSWINFGPLGFSYGSELNHYSPEEVQEILKDSGFEVKSWEQEQIPYLQSPGSGHWRTETVWTFRAEKVKNSKEPSRYHYLPDWLEDLDKPIPQEDFLAAVSAQSRFQFEVLTAVDGQRSLNEIATMMTTHYGLELEMAKDALLTFLIRSFEEK
ncbi:MAG: class I SAM-dependent methyltransferase [Bdellovibrionaceae bacterium]|nr:class I SAM-dependent methyltransferase [Pseudobdellovibrionaceae bacterium]